MFWRSSVKESLQFESLKVKMLLVGINGLCTSIEAQERRGQSLEMLQACPSQVRQSESAGCCPKEKYSSGLSLEMKSGM